MSAATEQTQTEMPSSFVLADSAAANVAEWTAEDGNADLKLRVYVQDGGCSGSHYGFTFDEFASEDDTVMAKNGVSLRIDAMRQEYLAGVEIDDKDDLDSAQLVIKNKSGAATTCGCGSSLSV